MKKIWITALDKEQQTIQPLMTVLKRYGLGVDGHFWVDDLPRMAWDSALANLAAKDTAVWIILGSQNSLATATIRQGLSLLALAVQHRRGVGFPVLLISPDGEIDASGLPTLFKGADTLPFDLSVLGTKITAMANKPVPALEPGYRLNLHALHGIGLWFEVGPAAGSLGWPGALCGVHGADIDFHGVGPADGVPERTVLEYPMKGMKIQMGQDELIAWAVQNRLDGTSSYYVRVQGTPDKLVFGPFATGDDAEVHAITLG